MGGGLLGISIKIIFIFKTCQKRYQSWDNLQSLDPSLHFSFLNCPNLITIFCRVLKMKIIFLISLAIPCPSPSRILWPINFIKTNWRFCIFSRRKKSDKFSGTLLYISVLNFFLSLKIYRRVNDFGKLD